MEIEYHIRTFGLKHNELYHDVIWIVRDNLIIDFKPLNSGGKRVGKAFLGKEITIPLIQIPKWGFKVLVSKTVIGYTHLLNVLYTIEEILKANQIKTNQDEKPDNPKWIKLIIDGNIRYMQDWRGTPFDLLVSFWEKEGCVVRNEAELVEINTKLKKHKNPKTFKLKIPSK